MNKRRYLTCAIGALAILTSGCVFKPRVIPGMDELEALCLKDAGAIVNGIEKVDGYYQATTKEYGGWDEIVYGQYDFIEYEHVKNKPGTPVDGKPPGFYRDYKANKTDPNCNPYYANKIKEYNVEPYISFDKKFCVATKKISKFKSKYQLSSTGEELIDNPQEGYEIHRSVTRIENIKTKKILGESTSYLLFPYGIYKTPESYITSQCSQVNKFKFQSSKNKNIRSWVFDR
ncbi:hypothetical protein [Zooshikella harenae]|uniref:Lipoprotein n=1 Tax=Zooshikella harenae TaxID=2827238 RepID=A0ABS5ZLM9_9GAMM|nr:hypothetical protein [Zooshikella harenae]MBU2714345.1 hypothetical protein [Zooshikella harenae]